MPAATVGPLSLRLAAANGDPSAEFEVGARLAEGKGTAQNFKEAAKWYQLSADHGFAQAQYRLGTLYERGLGLKPDRAQALAWYRRAADQGNIKAMHNLAVLSANQSDQSPDYATAAHWFEEAAKRGLADSQFNLAVLYENGLGVTRDMKQAFMWLSLAARDGDNEAVRRRDILRGKLTAEEIAAAEQMISRLEAGALRSRRQRCPHRRRGLEEKSEERRQRLAGGLARPNPSERTSPAGRRPRWPVTFVPRPLAADKRISVP